MASLKQAANIWSCLGYRKKETTYREIKNYLSIQIATMYIFILVHFPANFLPSFLGISNIGLTNIFPKGSILDIILSQGKTTK